MNLLLNRRKRFLAKLRIFAKSPFLVAKRQFSVLFKKGGAQVEVKEVNGRSISEGEGEIATPLFIYKIVLSISRAYLLDVNSNLAPVFFDGDFELEIPADPLEEVDLDIVVSGGFRKQKVQLKLQRSSLNDLSIISEKSLDPREYRVVIDDFKIAPSINRKNVKFFKDKIVNYSDSIELLNPKGTSLVEQKVLSHKRNIDLRIEELIK